MAITADKPPDKACRLMHESEYNYCLPRAA